MAMQETPKPAMGGKDVWKDPLLCMRATAQALGATFHEFKLSSCFDVVAESHSNALKVQAILRDAERMGLACPKLSLHHEDSKVGLHSNRLHVEEQASNLLSRPINLKTDGVPVSDNVQSLSELSVTVLVNICETFATLIDSRIRAYASFLARHGLNSNKKSRNFAALERIEKKIERLLELGAMVRSPAVLTRFEVAESSVKEKESSTHCNAPITFLSAMDIVLPISPAEDEIMSISMTTTGTMKVARNHSCDGPGIELYLDTRHLLQMLIQNASNVVARIVQAANCVDTLGDSPRSMDSVLHQLSKTTIDLEPRSAGYGLDLLCRAAANCRVVSPEIKSMPDPPSLPFPSLELSGDTADVSHLSPDQCADVVDGVFGDLDDAVLSPTRKRARLGF